jgi:hypothetical protein
MLMCAGHSGTIFQAVPLESVGDVAVSALFGKVVFVGCGGGVVGLGVLLIYCCF